MQMKMYRCNDQWFVDYDSILACLGENGFYPPLENGMEEIHRIAAGEYTPLPSSSDLPQSVSLQSKMPPVYDQFSRGTCVAQAATALMEYYTDCKWHFSMQYLFERIKRLEKDKFENTAMEIVNGQPISDPKMIPAANQAINILHANELEITRQNIAAVLLQKKVSLSDGSFGYMAMEILDKYGVCTNATLPYARQQLGGKTADVDAARADLPPGADEEAARHRLLDPYYVFPSPNNVEEIKRYLAGSNDNRPMPVMVGVLTLDHLKLEGDRIRIPGLKSWKVESANCEVVPVLDEQGRKVGAKINGFDESSLQEAEPVFSMVANASGSWGSATTTSSPGVTSRSVDEVRHTASAAAKRRSPSPPNCGSGRWARIGTVMETIRSASFSRGIGIKRAASPFGAKVSGVI